MVVTMGKMLNAEVDCRGCGDGVISTCSCESNGECGFNCEILDVVSFGVKLLSKNCK